MTLVSSLRHIKKKTGVLIILGMLWGTFYYSKTTPVVFVLLACL